MLALPALAQSALDLPSQRSAPVEWTAPARPSVRVATNGYIDAVSVEVVHSAVSDPSPPAVTRAQAAIRLYMQVSRLPERPAPHLHIEA